MHTHTHTHTKTNHVHLCDNSSTVIIVTLKPPNHCTEFDWRLKIAVKTTFSPKMAAQGAHRLCV